MLGLIFFNKIVFSAHVCENRNEIYVQNKPRYQTEAGRENSLVP